MRRAVPILTALLVGQIVLAGALHLGAIRGQAVSPGLLVEFDPAQVDAVVIADGDGDGSEMRIERTDDGGWRLPAVDGFPADSSKVERLLGKLGAMKRGMPVARTEDARDRFRVAADQYERRIELLSGDDTVATIFFGETDGARYVYARAKGDDTIHDVEFSVWRNQADASRWFDQSVPAVETAHIRQARLPDFRLRRDADGGPWRLIEGTAVKDALAHESSRLIRRLAQPEIKGVTKAEPPAGEPTLAYTLRTDDGKEILFRYFPSEDDTKVYLYRGDQPWRYEVAQSKLAQLTGTEPKTLLAHQSSGASTQAAVPHGKSGSS